MRNALTKYDVEQALRRLAVVYPSKTRETMALAEEWHRALHYLSRDAIDAAVSAYVASDARFFPTPGAIRKLAKEQPGPGLAGDARAYWAWEEVKGDGSPCPVCGSVLACLDCGQCQPWRCACTARLSVAHDHQRHLEAGIGYIGARGVRTGPRLVGAES